VAGQTAVTHHFTESKESPVNTTVPDDPAHPFANRVLPSVARTTAGLEPYGGPFGNTQRLHLLRRTLFGFDRSTIASVSGLTLDALLDQLLATPSEETSMPLVYSTSTTETVPVGSPWVTDTTSGDNSRRTTSLRAWWLSLMLGQTVSLREKMTLFWHNHFVTAMATVGSARFSCRYAALLRRHSLGNFKTLAREATIDGAMLRYLNGNRNIRTRPDENYARELQELFTIGKGPQVGPGDYTNYTEEDVKEAARVLTGWRDFVATDGTIGQTTSEFRSSNHDTGAKTFSARYGSTVIAGSSDGLAELNALLDMIFAQPETARYLCRKLYRWFVYYIIDEWTESNIIEPLAQTLRTNGYDVVPVLRQLLASAHFYDPLNIGCIIKNPLDHVVGTCRHFSLAIPASTVTIQYTMWTYLVNQASATQQLVGDPPEVSGWAAYYQSPQYYELWINSDTLPKRSAWTTRMITTGYTSGGAKIQVDPIAFAQTLSNAGDISVLVQETAELLFPIPLTANQVTALKQVVLAGQEEYVWTSEWSTYLGDPSNTTNRTKVLTRLQSLLRFMMEMPEYHLM